MRVMLLSSLTFILSIFHSVWYGYAYLYGNQHDARPQSRSLVAHDEDKIKNENKNSKFKKFPCSYPLCADGRNCAKEECSGCPFNCFRTNNTTKPTCPDKSTRCKFSCKPESTQKECSGCIYTKPPVPVKLQCSLGTFRDVTQMMFSNGEQSKERGEDSEHSYDWYQWFRSGKPHWHFSSALMVDVNGDSMLDYFNSMHGTMYNTEENGTSAGIQLAETVLNNTRGERDMNKITHKKRSEPSMYLKEASWRIIIDDPESEGYVGVIDKHGDLMADLDNDGILDLLIMSGGGSGSTIKYPKSKDNLLLFGERAVDEETGREVTVFKGGRKVALAAGLEGRTGRGRISYLLDVNKDGLLDIFLTNIRRKDNSLVPGSLYINQGNRTWREDTTMVEFSDVMILTDADGDSIAEEIMVIRGFCFPERKKPKHDDEYGPFPDDILEFCSTRPIGSTAIYKFDNVTQKMEDISPKYVHIDAAKSMQPECCPHGLTDSYKNSCSAASIASGDLDGDGRTDHVVLYARRMEFFFSSERPIGELPIEKKYVGLTIELPPSCTIAYSVRLVDIDNSGKQDIIVMCENIATFLIYTQKNKNKKTSWRLRKNCNDHGSLGDLSRFSSFNVTLDDLIDACNHRDEYRHINDLCEGYEKNDIRNPQHRGLTLADINNDGFTDAVVGSRTGYQKFFLYQPSKKSRRNRHISFRLVGDARKGVNLYGIGATIVLITRHQKTEKIRTQMREISSYQHTTEKRGHQDEKIIFGLGKGLLPVKLVTRWPNGVEQVLWLSEFHVSNSMSLYPALDVHYHDFSQYFRIRLKKLSNSMGRKKELCLYDTGFGGARMINLELTECAEVTKEEEHFSFNEWGMLKSRSSEYCVTQLLTGKVRLTPCDTGRSKDNSWHETRHGHLRWSGSNKVLGVEDAIVGEAPKVMNMNATSSETQIWILEDVM